MSTPAAPVSAVSWRAIGVVAVPVGLLLFALSGRYGYHRDELYFLAAGHHLAWGYPDQGPLVPAIGRLMDELVPGSLVAFRLPATVAAVVGTVVSALTARELGGRAFAQGLTALVVGTGVFTLITGHLMVTATLDFPIWVVSVFFVVRILRTGHQRLWLLVGLVMGVGLLNKALPAVLALGLFVGVLMVPSARPQLRSGWLWIGSLIAAAIWVPYLLWQADHGWPQLELAHDVSSEYSTVGERLGFFALQLLGFGLVGGWLWITGLVRLWRSADWPKVLVWTWLTVIVVFIVTAGQGYYTAGIYPALIAAGAVRLEERLRRPVLVVAVALALALVFVPAELPVLSASTLANSPWSGLAENQFEAVGWPEFTAQVAAAFRTIPTSQRADATILTENYGEAGAIDRYGPAIGLPNAYSGLNAYGYWGPPPSTATWVTVVSEDGPPSRLLRQCRYVKHVTNNAGVDNEESQSAAIYVCRAPAAGWAVSWPKLTHLGN
jgi:4-amino-4-deoxy-L-arabinose transferase-like glycosyltransferase